MSKQEKSEKIKSFRNCLEEYKSTLSSYHSNKNNLSNQQIIHLQNTERELKNALIEKYIADLK